MITFLILIISILDIIFNGFSIINMSMIGACILCILDSIFLGDRLI